MEQVAVFEERIAVTPRDLHNEIPSMDDLIMKKMRLLLEGADQKGKCSRHGFVIPGTLQLLSRSMGELESGHFTGDFLFYVKAQGKVYNPPDGTVVEATVLQKNKMGIYAIVKNAIKIIISRDLHIGNEEYESIQPGETIRVELKKSKFQINDTHILSIGQFLERVGAVPPLVPEEKKVVGEEEGESKEEKEGEEEEKEGEEEEQ
jgi:DNA-directed RNA polymerase subunit E'/Rpb7